MAGDATVTIPLAEYQTLLTEHQRMRSALETILAYVATAFWGMWRWEVANMARIGLGMPVLTLPSRS